jgi:hypothetical protein
VARWSSSTPRCLAGGVVVAIERVAVVAELDLDALAGRGHEPSGACS